LLPGCRSLATVASCFGGELVAYEVHSTRSYAVAGDLSGLLHRVVADATAACTVDTTRDPRLFSRALPDPNDDDGSNDIFFANPLVSFRLSAPSIAFRQVDLQFTIGTIAPKLIADIALVPGGRRIGVVPNEIFFSPLDHNLYVLDIAQRGLVELTLDPLTLARSFE